MHILFFLFGFALLLKGADWLVDGACSLARQAGVSQLIAGLTIVSIGTSLPELCINAVSRLSGNPDMTLGDIFGSNIANILLVLGIAAAVRPLVLKKSTAKWEIPYALAVASVLALLLKDDHGSAPMPAVLERTDGLILLILNFLFLFYVYRLAKASAGTEKTLSIREYPRARSWGMIAAGIPSLAAGAKGVVEGAAGMASAWGVAESVIALTIVAVGTSLPELMTSVVAAVKNRPDIAAGNVVGSNIFNISGILGISSAVRALPISSAYYPDIVTMIAVTLLLLGCVFFSREAKLTRGHGFVFLAFYIVYVAGLVWRHSY